MKRQKHWRQSNPMIQLRVILGAIHMELQNMQEGIASEQAIPRSLAMIQDSKEFAEVISKGDYRWS